MHERIEMFEKILEKDLKEDAVFAKKYVLS